MKKFFAIVALFSLTLLTTSSFAQLAIDKGTKFVNLGIGIGGSYFYGSGLGFNAAADFGVAKNITVGGSVGYRSFGNSVGGYDIGARGSYHFNELLNTPENVDLYAGLGLTYFGYTGLSGVTYDLSFISVPIHIGGRYMFAEKTGVFAELGSSVSTLKLGVTFKLGQ
ncbi:hypothetical protein [Fibrella forsythiae]|uniref:Outer membrane protein beta-barrel domain-containing protein n=1 Tax=Fibrella forsythiae TaxID=2817061 RepID=A0ABS3JJ12_9BACT|nr:hypothetical protein [Fibrella forsythiae]MBO0949985.1 hypothetical protein [Fibrella forsythiae]